MELAREQFYDPLSILDASATTATTDHDHRKSFPTSLAAASSLLSFPVERAASSSPNLLLTVSWIARFRRDFITFRFVEAVAVAGRLDILRLLDGLGVEQFSMATMDAAAREGRLDVVRLLNEKRSEGSSYAAMRVAGTNCHLEVVEYLWNAEKNTSWAVVLAEAAERAHTKVVEFLLDKVTGEVATDSNAETAMKELFSPDSPPPPFIPAIRSVSVEMLRLVESRFRPLLPPSASFMGAHFITAAVEPLQNSTIPIRLEMLEHLLKRGYRPDHSAFHTLITTGGAPAVAAMLKHVGKIDWPNAFDLAAETGDLDFVKLLHEHIIHRQAAGEAVGIGPTVSAMDEAARRGHLEVVRFCMNIGMRDARRWRLGPVRLAIWTW
ncbi:hypothetical protein HDU96_005626 [Phlyctochytrium bullatum]|nr:hypothetical protein HDU96_005626 [Phlyctochytrium bullatum]